MDSTTTTSRLACAITILALSLASFATGNQPAQAGGPPTAGVDAWQGEPRAGTSMVFYAAAAIVRGSYEQLVPMPNGGWSDPSGRSFGPQEVATASGHGLTLVDVVYRDARVCVGSVQAMGLDATTNALTSIGSDAFVTATDTCSDFWSDPTRLRTMPVGRSQALVVTRGPIEYAGQSFDALGIRSGQPGAFSYHSYDLATGFLLFGGSVTVGAAVAVPRPDGTSGPGPGNTLLTHTSLLGVRQLDLPAVYPGLPTHARNARALEYHGVQGTVLMGQAIEVPLHQRLERVDGGDAWVLLRATRQHRDPWTGIQSSDSFHAVMAASHIGGNYVAPELLAALARGRRNDQNPVTGVQTAVIHADDRVVTIERRTNAELMAWTYDLASGWLVEASWEQQLGMGTTYVRLELRSVN